MGREIRGTQKASTLHKELQTPKESPEGVKIFPREEHSNWLSDAPASNIV